MNYFVDPHLTFVVHVKRWYYIRINGSLHGTTLRSMEVNSCKVLSTEPCTWWALNKGLSHVLCWLFSPCLFHSAGMLAKLEEPHSGDTILLCLHNHEVPTIMIDIIGTFKRSYKSINQQMYLPFPKWRFSPNIVGIVRAMAPREK